MFCSYIIEFYLKILNYLEAEAARKSGLEVFLVRRKDNPDKSIDDFKWIESFDQIEL